MVGVIGQIIPNKLSLRDKMVSLRQLAVLLGSGVPLLRALQVLDQQGVHPALRAAWSSVIKRVLEGQSLARAMAANGRVFGLLEVGLVRAAERSANLADVLHYLADLLSREYRLKRAVSGAMYYPLFLFGAALSGMVLFMLHVLPVFMKGLESEAELPMLSRLLVWVANTVSDVPFMLLVAAMMVASVWMACRYIATPQGRYKWHQLLLHTYGVGCIFKLVLLARFCQTLAVLMRSGMPLPLCLEIAGDSLANYQLSEAVRAVNGDIKDGYALGEAFGLSSFFPSYMSHMLTVSEETGDPASALSMIGKSYEQRADLAVEQFTQLLEPIMLAFIGIMMGVSLIGMFLPLYHCLDSL
ncbi:type II secretion system F family protein [bacterium]|nr:type II secretion system F family protein [bacterium]